MIFIRNCSNSDLASMFKPKPISKWSAKEAQEAIDEHQLEHSHFRGQSVGASCQILKTEELNSVYVESLHKLVHS